METNTCRHATRKNNMEKNQNQKCIPYDYNRVVLDKIDRAVDSDYVNASYVDVIRFFYPILSSLLKTEFSFRVS